MNWTVVFLAVLLQQAAPRVKSEFAEVLAQILRAAPDGFRPVQGARIENRRRDYFFESKVYLPGANYCQILERPGAIFDCEWRKPGPKEFDRLSAEVEATLGPEWTRKTKPRKNGKEAFFSGPGKAVVQVIAETPAVHVYVTPTPDFPNGIEGELPARPPLVF